MEEKRTPESGEPDERLREAYRLYQRNIRAVDPLVYRITLGARQGTPEEELLALALEALDRCDFGENAAAGEPPENDLRRKQAGGRKKTGSA